MNLLTDSQVPQPFTVLLRAVGTELGWKVDTVYQHHIQHEKKDARIVAWGHANDFVIVTLDDLKAESGAEVAREIRDRGGRVIVISGGPQQPIERAVGKLLFHMEVWLPFLESGDGRVGHLGHQARLSLPPSGPIGSLLQADTKS